MVKVFTTSQSPSTAGDELTQQFNKWVGDECNIEILNIHSNSNSYGWMLVVHYKTIV